MAKLAIRTPNARSRARPDSEAVSVRMPNELLDRINSWRAAQSGKPTRAEAVLRLLTSHFWPSL